MDDDPAENDPDENPSREKWLLNAFKQPFNKVYAIFVLFVIPVFDSFNTFLQAKEPLIHTLHHSTLRLYYSLLSSINIDLEDPDVLKDFISIFIGRMTKQYTRDSDIVGTSEYKKSSKEVRAFFIKCAKYLQTSINTSFKKRFYYVFGSFLRLPERHRATLAELHVLMQRLLRVILFCD